MDNNTRNRITRNLIAHINRQLATRGLTLRTSHSNRERNNLGDYYIIDTYKNEVVDSRVNLRTLESMLPVDDALMRIFRVNAPRVAKEKTA